MKRIFRHLTLLGCAMMFFVGTLSAKGEKEEKMQTVYIFGTATSFGDSIVHFTEIQEIQGVGLVNKGFLTGRALYSYQLKNYLENAENLPNRTCTVFFSEKRHKLEKKYFKLKQKKQADKSLACRILNSGAFSFKKYDAEY